jgi:hypothetical protein
MSGAFSFLSRFLKPAGAAKEYSLAENYAVLRDSVFSTKRNAVGDADVTRGPGVWGVVMETGYPGVVATLVAMADGSVSLYFSNGGGIIGLGGEEGPQRASRALLEAAPQFRDRLEPTTKYPLPLESHVRFFLLCREATLTAEAREEELSAGSHALAPLYQKAHALITEIRLLDEKRHHHPSETPHPST